MEDTLTLFLPLVGEPPGLVENVLEFTADLLCSLMAKFGKLKERKTELYASNLFNLIIEHYLGSTEHTLYCYGLRILNSFLRESPAKFSEIIASIHEDCMESQV